MQYKNGDVFEGEWLIDEYFTGTLTKSNGRKEKWEYGNIKR